MVFFLKLPKTDALHKVQVVEIKLKASSKTTRELFVETYRSREVAGEKPVDRTMVAYNAPPFVHEPHLLNAFKPFGATAVIIQDEAIDKIPAAEDRWMTQSSLSDSDSQRVAYIAFESKQQLTKFMDHPPTTPLVLFNKGETLPIGVKLWSKQYNDSIENADELLAQVNKDLQEYDERVEKERELAKKRAGEADDEGWVTVTKHGKKRKAFGAGEAHDQGVLSKEAKKQAKQDKAVANVGNFYKYKKEETKLSKLADLRKKFEEDKKRVAEMKQKRKFKPL